MQDRGRNANCASDPPASLVYEIESDMGVRQLSSLRSGCVCWVPLGRALSTMATLAAQCPLQALDRPSQPDRPQSSVHTSPNITKRLAVGEMPDVLVAQSSTVDQMIKDGRAIAATRKTIGRIGVGVAASRGGRRPDISTVDALKASLLQADAVVYSQGASGLLGRC